MRKRPVTPSPNNERPCRPRFVLLRALFHEAGGLKMGADPKTSVTDPWGRVRGTRGLYVADASTFPTGGDRHPTLTILALAARTAHHIIESARRGEP